MRYGKSCTLLCLKPYKYIYVQGRKIDAWLISQQIVLMMHGYVTRATFLPGRMYFILLASSRKHKRFPCMHIIPAYRCGRIYIMYFWVHLTTNYFLVMIPIVIEHVAFWSSPSNLPWLWLTCKCFQIKCWILQDHFLEYSGRQVFHVWFILSAYTWRMLMRPSMRIHAYMSAYIQR